MRLDEEAAVECELQYSGGAASAIAAAYCATGVLLAAVPFPAWAAAPAALALGLQALAACRALRSATALRLAASRAIAVRDARGRWRHGALRDGCFVAPWLVLLRWRPALARRDRILLIAPGGARPGALRKIRVLARWA